MNETELLQQNRISHEPQNHSLLFTRSIELNRILAGLLALHIHQRLPMSPQATQWHQVADVLRELQLREQLSFCTRFPINPWTLFQPSEP